MNPWTSFTALAGGASGGLIALTFITTSIRRDDVAKSPLLRNRAAQTLTLFLTVLVTSLLGMFAQPATAFGIEAVAVGVASLTVLQVLEFRARRDPVRSRRVWPAFGIAAFTGLLVAGGAVVAAGFEWGMYLYATSQVLGLLLGATSAWVFLISADAPADESSSAGAAAT